jgi:hypothetical protein
MVIVGLAGMIRGLHEGMINIAPWDDMYSADLVQVPGGVRKHAWHDRWYHVISPGRDILIVISTVIAALNIADWRWGIPAGCLGLLWESNEIGEAFARQGCPVYRLNGEVYEYINFGEKIKKQIAGRWVWVLHAARIGWFIIFTIKFSF